MGSDALARQRRLQAFNDEQQEASAGREHHRRQCLDAALQSGLTAGAAGSGLTMSALCIRPQLVSNTSIKSFLFVFAFFLPFSLSMHRALSFASAAGVAASH
jgi:hypothetical protein